ncbi:hypothetical protein C6I20_13065 [Aeromicrobium sp. A1-2]|uniref:hypothetical protein n=1 Tax=Aeromicrobium sp. A1-2 TaxID=2107713 RepID=UPI000E4DE31C|nr:hypothetical protein [Aeromicrobium sp. A1-2]AXT86023.1 hypothetical protein C6I20_13065 [Aeromicrobium sp. A1-2]
MFPATTAREERGAAALLLVVSGIVAGLMVLTLWALPIAGASSQQAKTQSAADAAALAGADAVVGGLADTLKGLSSWNGSYSALGTTSGAERAAVYADQNGATLISYAGPPTTPGWTTRAGVRRIVDGQVYESRASARLDLPSCSTEEVEPPPTDEVDPPPTDEGEEPEEGDEPPPPPDSTVSCEGLPAFTIVEGDLSLSTGWAGFVDALLGGSHAKLTG